MQCMWPLKYIRKKLADASQKTDVSKKHLKLHKTLEEQFLNDEFSDVKIICDGKIFDCHKFIVLSQSDFFKGNNVQCGNLFQGGGCRWELKG